MLAAVIFDMDGVILDSEPLHDRGSMEVFKAAAGRDGRCIEPDLLAFRGRTEKDFWSHIQQKHQLPLTMEELIRRKESCFLELLRSEPEVQAFPGLASFVRSVKDEMTVALASSSSHAVIDATLTRLGLLDAFATRVSGVDVTRGKPAPDIFLLTAQKLGVAPPQCVVIEDSVSGIAAARAAGMYCLGFLGNEGKPENMSAATAILRTFEGLDAGSLRALVEPPPG
jgi:HAD superfamily hydrolase (TIGR01509 family)